MAPFFIFVGLIVLVALLAHLAAPTEAELLMHERRRHAVRAARAMRRMSAIRQETARRMDRAEGSFRR